MQNNRAGKRDIIREMKKKQKKLDKFNNEQKRIIIELIEEAVKQNIEIENTKFKIVMDRCVKAYLFLTREDITPEEVNKEIEILAELIAEDALKIDERFKVCEGDYEIMNKKLDKYAGEMRPLVNKLMNKGIKKSEIIKELEMKFPSLSKVLLVNAYEEFKAERLEMQRKVAEKALEDIEPEIVDAAEYIFQDEKPKPKQEVKVEPTPKEPVKPLPVQETKELESDLKIISKNIIVQGKFDKYTVTNETVKAGDLEFKSLLDLEAYEKKEIETFMARIGEIKKVMEMV